MQYKQFAKNVKDYVESIVQKIKQNIKIQDIINAINSKIIQLEEKIEVIAPILIDNITLKNKKIFDSDLNAIDEILKFSNDLRLSKNMKNDNNFIKLINNFILNIESKKKELIQNKDNLSLFISLQNGIRNIIINKKTQYRIESDSSSVKYDSYLTEKSEMISQIKELFSNCIEEKKVMIFKDKLACQDEVKDSGFVFNFYGQFHNLEMKNEVIGSIFKKPFSTDLSNLVEIRSFEQLNEAVKKPSNSSEDPFERISVSTNAFIDKNTLKASFRQKIREENEGENIGSTMGEMSYATLKYEITKNAENNINALILDQPEDNISNKNINLGLISKINSLRNKKQVIIVTHNPNLLINLDADNVIFISKDIKTNKVEVKNGSLDFENENYNIMKLIIENMEGGIEALRKRAEIYKYETNKNKIIRK